MLQESRIESEYDAEHKQRFEEAKKHGRIEAIFNDQAELITTAFSKSPCEYCNGQLAGERISAYYTPIN